MKKLLGKYLKRGIGILIPVVLVIFVLNWLYNLFNNVVIAILPSSMNYEWWYVFIFVVGLAIVILLIGWLFSYFRLLGYLKGKSEMIVDKVPVVGTIYNFGKELVDGFISDVKEDGDTIVVEVMFAGQKTLGMLTDPTNNMVFIPTAPNPLNGFLMKTDTYNTTDIAVMDFMKMLGSLGKVGGENWKTKIKEIEKEN